MNESVGADAFRECLAHFASGVIIVTMRTPEGLRGFTVSAFTSASLEPPLILVCVDKHASMHAHLAEGAHFGVSMLARDQAWIATQFSRRNVDRFLGVALREGPVAGVPLIGAALAHIECTVHARHTAGDHTIVLGKVLSASSTAGRPLVHFERGFGSFTEWTSN